MGDRRDWTISYRSQEMLLLLLNAPHFRYIKFYRGFWFWLSFAQRELGLELGREDSVALKRFLEVSFRSLILLALIIHRVFDVTNGGTASFDLLCFTRELMYLVKVTRFSIPFFRCISRHGRFPEYWSFGWISGFRTFGLGMLAWWIVHTGFYRFRGGCDSVNAQNWIGLVSSLFLRCWLVEATMAHWRLVCEVFSSAMS